MSLETVTVTWTEQDIGQAPLGGNITFTLNEPVADSASGIDYRPVPKTYFFTSATGTSDPLLANDSPTLQPAGSYYTITVAITGQAAYTFASQILFASGASQTLAFLQANAAVPAAQYQAYLPLPTGTPAAGQVPVVQTNGSTQTAWGNGGGGGGGVVDSVTAADASVTVGGTTANPTVRTGRLDQIATLHPPTAAVAMNSQKLTGLASGSASGDSVAFGQLGTAAFQASSAFDAAGAAAAAQAAAEAASDPAGSASAAQAASLQKTSNLSDVANAATARTNLGLGTAATQASSAFDAAGAASTALTAAETYADTNKLAKSASLSDVASASTARTNLGLGTAATQNTGVASGVAQLDASVHLASSQAARPTLYAPTGLRRFRAALGDSLFSQIPIVCIGDSIVAGQGGDNNLSTFSNIPDNANGWAGQLRAQLALAIGTYPGEGFIFADDSRVTWAGGTANANWACVPLRHGPRLVHGSGNTLALTVPAGVTSLGVIQANETQAFNVAGSNLADVSALYSQTGSVTVTNQPITTLTNTGRALETDIACQPGDTVTISAPATAQSYIAGFNLKSAQAGVLVHRIGQPGYVSGDMLGGQTSGTLTQAASSSNQTAAERACYDWAKTSWTGQTGLVIVGFGTNDQQFQAGTGSAGGVTLSLYTTWMTQFMNQAIADGWCCLMLAPPRNPSAAGSGSTQDQYFAAMQSYALGTDHAAYLDVGDLWGSNAAAAALNLGAITSVHPNRAGHGDIARMLAAALTSRAGITEITAA